MNLYWWPIITIRAATAVVVAAAAAAASAVAPSAVAPSAVAPSPHAGLLGVFSSPLSDC